MRVKRSLNARKKRKMYLKAAKGYRGSLSRRYKLARQQYYRSGQYAYSGRKQKKSDYRKLWITRINAASRAQGLKYNEFIHGLKLANININRKMLSELAINDPDSFNEYMKIAKQTLATK
ncbi:50S ribosomal protein L20 [Defluviitoga tunisiensis]|uniref:Large ribosomal subunit protein bL20 n=1 Tax=Defluviitoga tunisiensis TaxID=1006576 RepID=A0A0C7P1L2_DEFTU|nr:50S ribosomal protein L20 [Defluviitoga tunisiensis]CEP77869.1 50S ribosomal protein L20 [Defluviitoga tunisiensis]